MEEETCKVLDEKKRIKSVLINLVQNNNDDIFFEKFESIKNNENEIIFNESVEELCWDGFFEELCANGEDNLITYLLEHNLVPQATKDEVF